MTLFSYLKNQVKTFDLKHFINNTLLYLFLFINIILFDNFMLSRFIVIFFNLVLFMTLMMFILYPDKLLDIIKKEPKHNWNVLQHLAADISSYIFIGFLAYMHAWFMLILTILVLSFYILLININKSKKK